MRFSNNGAYRSQKFIGLTDFQNRTNCYFSWQNCPQKMCSFCKSLHNSSMHDLDKIMWFPVNNFLNLDDFAPEVYWWKKAPSEKSLVLIALQVQGWVIFQNARYHLYIIINYAAVDLTNKSTIALQSSTLLNHFPEHSVWCVHHHQLRHKDITPGGGVLHTLTAMKSQKGVPSVNAVAQLEENYVKLSNMSKVLYQNRSEMMYRDENVTIQSLPSTHFEEPYVLWHTFCTPKAY